MGEGGHAVPKENREALGVQGVESLLLVSECVQCSEMES